jgi:hypothetical protein
VKPLGIAAVIDFDPDLIVVSGDLVDDPSPEHLLAAKCALEDLSRRARLRVIRHSFWQPLERHDLERGRQTAAEGLVRRVIRPGDETVQRKRPSHPLTRS